ncbi:hypothetical protein Golob_007642 [Gossypium lobatum]|uniref:CCHC-type domain-containing protein n=1 Tax=Gossypium lobatum TaxID=34289 RepID=A0A7J8MDE8_9ROSI|nr:hypothetical protein [Gossypium lobatum]
MCYALYRGWFTWLEEVELRLYAIKYERLLTFCYICGLIGHTKQSCSKKDELLETNNLSFQYGSWPRAQIGGPNQNRGFWRNGIEILDKSSPSSEANNKSKTRTREEDEIWTKKEKQGLEMKAQNKTRNWKNGCLSQLVKDGVV